jgi:hypothetical protein
MVMILGRKSRVGKVEISASDIIKRFAQWRAFFLFFFIRDLFFASYPFPLSFLVMKQFTVISVSFALRRINADAKIDR